MKITWLYLIKSRISCGLASWNLERIIRVVTSRSRQHINVGVFGVCDWINMQPTGSLIYLYTKISSIISWFKSDLTEFSWCPADRQQKWNSEIKPAELAERPGPSLTGPPWKRRPKNGRQKPLCLFFLWMLHVWLSEEKTRKLPSKHKWDYSLGSWRSQSLCSADQKQLESSSSFRKQTTRKRFYFDF